MEQYDEDLKKKQVKYAWKWKWTVSLCWQATTAPNSPPKTPAWVCTGLPSAPAFVRWRQLPPSSSLPCGQHPSPAAALGPAVPTSQQKMSLPGWSSGQRGIRKATLSVSRLVLVYGTERDVTSDLMVRSRCSTKPLDDELLKKNEVSGQSYLRMAGAVRNGVTEKKEEKSKPWLKRHNFSKW